MEQDECARCHKVTEHPVLLSTGDQLDENRFLSQYFKRGELVICRSCLNADSNYIRDYGRLP